MKHKILIFCLNLLRRLSTIFQIGNPAGKAPHLLDEPIDEEEIYQHREASDTVYVWRLRRVLCSAMYGGTIISEKNTLYSRFTYFPWGKSLHPTLSFPYLGKKKISLERAIFLITPEAKGNYYHWMIDLLPRLLLIRKSNLPDFLHRDIIVHHSERVYETDTFSLLNIPTNRVIRIAPLELVSVEDLIIADYFGSEKIFPMWKKTLLNEFKQQIIVPLLDGKTNAHEKVYLYRGKQRRRRLIGEEKLVNTLKKLEFDIVDPQRLTVAEQANIMSQAKVVVSLHSAALTNIVFCEEGTKIIELRSFVNPPQHYVNIAKAYNLHFDSISVSPERIRKGRHSANKQNLVLSEETIDLLLTKLTLQKIAKN